jgi:hypothetical protein
MKKQHIITAFALLEKDGSLYPYGSLALNVYATKELAESRSKEMRGTRVVQVLIYPKNMITEGLPNQDEIIDAVKEYATKDKHPQSFCNGWLACMTYLKDRLTPTQTIN